MKSYISELCEILDNEPKIYEIMRQCPYEILKKVKVQEYKNGTLVFEQGVKQQSFYIVVDGKFDIYITSENGKQYLMQTYGKGTYIGELEIFDNKPYVSQVEAKSDAKMIEIDRETFLKWIDIDKNFCSFILKSLCRSTYTLCENIGWNTLHSLKERICVYLIEETKKLKNGKEKGVKINTDNLSSQMAVTQRSVTRILKQLKEEKIIDIQNSTVTIEDYDRLLEQLEDKI